MPRILLQIFSREVIFNLENFYKSSNPLTGMQKLCISVIIARIAVVVLKSLLLSLAIFTILISCQDERNHNFDLMYLIRNKGLVLKMCSGWKPYLEPNQIFMMELFCENT